MRALTTEDNAAAGKIIGRFVSVIYAWYTGFFRLPPDTRRGNVAYRGPPIDDNNADGGNLENLCIIMIETVH